jgi:hypothetical protein
VSSMGALDPFDIFKDGVMRARRVNKKLFLEARDAAKELRLYANPGPLRYLLGPLTDPTQEWLVRPRELWQLGDAIRRVTCLDDDDIGLGLHILFWPVAFPEGVSLVDASDRTYSPLWLEAMPNVDGVLYDASQLLDELDWDTPAMFTEDIHDAISNHILEGRSGSLDAQEQRLIEETFARWEAELGNKTSAFREKLKTLADRNGSICVWYEENLSL